MTEMNLLLVEDNEQDQQSCNNAVKDFKEDNQCQINIKVCVGVEDALKSLNESYYDGAIIDMRLAEQGNEGNQVIEQIRDNFRRIPVVIMTGTPDVAEMEGFPLIGKYVKGGEIGYSDVIQELWGIYRTGLTRIMGGRGEIEQKLSQIFIKNLLPQRKSWIEYGKEDHEKSEKAFLRHALNHLIQILDGDVDKCYPEEMYIYPPVSTRINTGCIVKSKNSDNFYVVMNPACDLAERDNGGCNTDRALLVEIKMLTDIFPDFDWRNLSRSNNKELEKVYKNIKSGYYHWLPKVDFFDGGVLNFRGISTYTEDELGRNFEEPMLQISPAFVKDMVSRFSSYYARQGQPDIDHEKVQIKVD
jgi:CheY-like chemotaxis protein